MSSANSTLKSKQSIVPKCKVAPYEIEIRGVPCVDQRNQDTGQFYWTEVRFTLVPDRDGDTVCLRGFKFFFKLTRAVTAYHICSLSNESYLVSDFAEKLVVKLDASSGEITSLILPSLSGALCSLDENRAAVSIEKRRPDIPYEILVLYTKPELMEITSFNIKEKCTGLAYLNGKLYVGYEADISTYSTEGSHLETIYRPDPGTSIDHLANGPNRQLICVTANWLRMTYNIVKEDGSIEEVAKADAICPKYTLFSLPFFAFQPRLTTIDSYRNVYIYTNLENPMEQRGIVKITREGRRKAQTYPLDVTAMCFDESLDMLAFMSDEMLVLESPI